MANQTTKKSEFEVRIIAERPIKIDNEELEGEFQGELKPNILHNHHYMLVSERHW